MRGLSDAERSLVEGILDPLAAVDGVAAIVLGGSRARGRALSDSDIDLGILYRDERPLSIPSIRALAEQLHDGAFPEVSELYGWGPWVNGGAWLRVGGLRVDLLYRSLEHVERVIAESEAGHFEVHHGQQPPYGFASPVYLGEIACCVPLFDPGNSIGPLKQRVATYPEALRRRIVQDELWSVEFGIDAFGRKHAARGDVYGAVGCMARFANALVHVLFALNRVYPGSDKTAMQEIDELAMIPQHFRVRVEAVLATPGHSRAELRASMEALQALFVETRELAADLYASHPLP